MIEIYPPKNNVPECVVLLGHQGENEASCVVFDLKAYADEFGAGTWAVVYRRPGEELPYPVTDLSESAGIALWILNDTDTGVAGEGRAEFRYYVDDVLVKSDVYRTLVLPSLGVPGPAPDPLEDVLEQMIGLKQDAEEAKSGAQNAAESASSSEAAALSYRNSASQSATDAAADAAAALGAKTAAEAARDLAEHYKDEAFHGTPEGYEEVSEAVLVFNSLGLYLDTDGDVAQYD